MKIWYTCCVHSLNSKNKYLSPQNCARQCGIYESESYLRQRIDAFELWCWRRLLRIPWTARRSNQSILKEISPGCSLKGLMLKLKLLIRWPPYAKSWLFGKDPDAGRDWGQEEKGTTEEEMVGWKASPTRWMWVWVNSRSWWWTGRSGVLRFMGSQRVGHNWATELN